MQMSLNLQAALLARAVDLTARYRDGAPFYVWDSLDACDALDQDAFWIIVTLLESIAYIGS